MRAQTYANLIVFSAISMAGCGASDQAKDQGRSPSTPHSQSQAAAPVITTAEGAIKTGDWAGQDAGGRANIKFRIQGPIKVTNMQMLVPVFGSSPGQNTCQANPSATSVKPPLNIVASDATDNTSIALSVKQSVNPGEMIMDVVGTCRGSLISLGLEIRAKWLKA